MLVSLWQFMNASSSMLVSWLFSANLMLVRPVQSWNAESPMHVTLSGMVILVKPEQPWKADSPMLVMLLGMVILVKLEQPWNAEVPMLVPSVITTVLSEVGTLPKM